MFSSSLFARVEAVRRSSPLVHCITNFVTVNFTANVLLAVGAAPAMVVAREEVSEFAAIANALSINLGTIDSVQAQSIDAAVAAARAAGVPWVLDPVAVGALKFRTDFALRLLESQPTVIRGNASEIISLAGGPASGRGVDSTEGTDAARVAARTLASRVGTLVAVTGATDFITDGKRAIELANGSPLMTRVTGTGCALSATVAAFVGAAGNSDDPWHATIAAVALTSIAGELAARAAHAPGSFAVAYLDRLATLDADEFSAMLRWQEG